MEYEDRKIAHIIIKNHTNGQTSFMDLRKFHYNVLCRTGMKELGADILAGRAKSVSAKHYLMNNIDELIKYYDNGWSEVLNDKNIINK